MESFANGALGTNALAEAIIRARAAAHFMMLVVDSKWCVRRAETKEGSNDHVMGREEQDASSRGGTTPRFQQPNFVE